MAESVAGFLLEKLSALLTQEASLLWGVRTEVKEINLELENMRAFLRDADRRKDSNEGLRTWVGQVRDATYEVEDIIDEFVYRMDRPQRGGFRGFPLNTITLLRNTRYRHRFATELQDLKRRIAAISMRKDQYNLINTEDGSSSQDANERWKHRGETALYEDDDEIVGLQERIDQIVLWLTEKEPRLTVISVVGMGGLGKTTLVAKACKHHMVKKHFECCVWVTVSQFYNVEGLLKSVITDLFKKNKLEVPSNVGSMDRHQLVEMVRDSLDTKRYLVVLDDVWNVGAWTDLNIAFPRNRCGSRIMLTTRNQNVASALGDGNRPFPLERLQEKEAWVLFSKKAFWKEPCPPELQHLAQKIVEKCGGLPLAIVSLGSLLSWKDKTALEWNRVYGNLSWQLTNDQMLERVKHILLLSFYDLPYHLKHCFLYCCMFPEDYLIHRKQLIRLWVAEGFVKTGKITMEEAAEGYLKELIHRNILQVVETNGFGRLRACRMHDIMREVALSISDEEKFCMTYDELQAMQNGKVRRMSIYSSGEINHSNTGMTHLRSLMVFDGNMSFSSSLNTMASSFRLLRVLNLRGILIESIPDEVTNMFNLRYLNLSETNVRELPVSLWKLQNLQTLDVRNTKLERLPSGIVKLQKLRHLYIYRITDKFYDDFDCFSSIQVPITICNLTSLQTLRVIENVEGELVRKVGNLTQLRSLSISKVREIDGAELCNSIRKMKHLLKLSVTANAEEETLQLEALSPNPPPLLQKLSLNGRLEKVPRWLSSLVNLAHLSLTWSKLREDPLPSLQALPNLISLFLRRAYEGQQLCFRDGSFTKLSILSLRDIKHLNQIVIEKGALASIQELLLINCGELKTLPEGIEYLTGLQELALLEMPTELTDRLTQKDGSEEYRSKVGHIPIILHGQRTEAEGLVMEPLN
ncbi:disease resistance protein RPM1-like [Magnolia sinica]|uniref:disease resistance protein RPM1-like n=1 Tax=Magnolia sinica TaxID=86752 RepID=UPI00265AA1E2|nr:disease resistance protein RPM1-like [Magnolia sinica]XP_058089103.1 disease resistance protein RPM1-like [Magnolia sinica]XP_058089104.1 disease resistance protein RPM1-like [Magnolia sinica]